MITLIKVFDNRDAAATEYNVMVSQGWMVAVSEDDSLVRVFRAGIDQPVYEENGETMYTLVATKSNFVFRVP